MIEESENIVKKTCRELGITQKELAEYFGVTAKAVSDWGVARYPLPKHFYIIIDLIKNKRDCETLKRMLRIS